MLLILERLERCPQVSGAKPARYDLAGSYRIRPGDWRVQFRVKGQTEQVKHRRQMYQE